MLSLLLLCLLSLIFFVEDAIEVAVVTVVVVFGVIVAIFVYVAIVKKKVILDLMETAIRQMNSKFTQEH